MRPKIWINMGLKHSMINDVNSTNYSYEEIKDGHCSLAIVPLWLLKMIKLLDARGIIFIYFTDDCLDSYFGLEQGGGNDMGLMEPLCPITLINLTTKSLHHFGFSLFYPLSLIPSFH